MPPPCGERIELIVDCSIEHQEYIEDCSVCCRPIVISLVTFSGEIDSLHVRSEDE
ncbi:CPXCG motif-containing cysteine-rich protein [Porticoccus sp.]|uniref:CPXCG motif-containing cysteine-rich protein n=1 Tax=Porticoccus sp. TaxID=2024853 RepID=UPI003F6972DA